MILIDGSNFYFKLKTLQIDLFDFDFALFAKELLEKNCNLIKATYYVGAIKTSKNKKSQKLFNRQRRLLSKLKNFGFSYFLGYLLKSDGVFHEKGVDIKIAADILVAVYENTVDKIILVSSDTDFLPVIKIAREKGKVVEYIGFKNSVSLAIKNNCDSYRLFSRADLLSFLP